MATNIKTQVSDVLEIISDLKGETSTNTDAKRIRAVSRAEQDVARRRFWRLHRLPDQSMSGDGTANYTIGSASYPMRNKGLIELFVGGTTEDKRVQILDFNKYKNEYNKNNSARIAYEWYDAVNDLWKVHINPIPAATDTIYYTYLWEPPERTSQSDYIYFYNPVVIARLALADIYESEDEDDKKTENLQLVEQMVEEAEGSEESPAENQLYAMTPIESSIQNRGLGGY